MDHLFYKLKETITRIFSGKYIFAQFVAIIFTFIIVNSGFDYMYFLAYDKTYIQHIFFSAVVAGGIIPIIFPLWTLLYGHLFKNKKVTILGNMLAQAVALGWIISSFYKSLTGRIPPAHTLNSLIDLSRDFSFGFLDGGVFWGWPSSHTTIAFAMALTIWSVYPRHVLIKYTTLLYAIYIGFGVSLSIHWFSDVIAGAIFGAVIGLSIGKSFSEKIRDSR
ncbi:TPA: hypothetical protein DEP94_01335 [Candidatus Nomurabacteria bacterium]|nr:hypothetical protein [Candidatus Nomurabacteria bacterium]